MAEGLAAALQPPENIAALVVALAHESSARFSGEVFYLEKNRLGLFDPLSVEQSVERAANQSPMGGMLDALTQLNPHASQVPYTSND